MQQDDRLLERHGVPDLHLAVRPLKHPRAGGVVEFRANHDFGTPYALGAGSPEKEDEGRGFLNALEHALLRQVRGAVVVPHLSRRKREGG